ncbi:MAG TPA: prepilin peptidase [Blastocatellia bacterium]|nr:prepilin peptidase [Blastocatellia bacterium]
MSSLHLIIMIAVLVPLAAIITYHDVRYRRIPNSFVLGTLVSGLVTNFATGRWEGLVSSLAGFSLAFALMFIQYYFGGLGAGDVKLFAAIGSLIGFKLVLPTFLIVLLIGGVVAAVSMLKAGVVRQTMVNVWMILTGLLMGWKMTHRSEMVKTNLTIPYGVAITFGSLISIVGAFVQTGTR